MAIKRDSRPVRQGGSETQYAISDVEELEKLSLERANKAISAIENAMAVWDASEDKPADLEPRLNRLKYIYEELTAWEKKMLKSRGKKEDMEARIERLMEFSGICRTYA